MTRHLTWLAMLVAAIAIPALATGEPRAPGAIRAAVDENRFQNEADPDSSSVTIFAGETVTFRYPEGGNFHNVDFLTIEPTTCTLTTGLPGNVPPLPSAPSPAPWSGICRFDTPG